MQENTVLQFEVSPAAQYFSGSMETDGYEGDFCLVSPFRLGLAQAVQLDIFYKRAQKNRLYYFQPADLYRIDGEILNQRIVKGDFFGLGMHSAFNQESGKNELLCLKKMETRKFLLDIFPIPKIIWSQRIFLFRTSR